MKILDSYLATKETYKDYYKQFTYNKPLMITAKTSLIMQFIQKCMVTCMRHLAINYADYEEIMPLSERTKEILKICDKYPYKPGTYRTDFIITDNNQIKLIEITCRFALNGYIRSGLVNNWAEQFAKRKNLNTEDRYSSFFNELELYFGDNEKITILKDDSFNEGRYFKPIIEKAGYIVNVIELEEITKNTELLRNSACIFQLRHDELFTLPDNVIIALMEGCLLNDLRTVLLIHDKRFFALLYEDRFRINALGYEDAELFKRYLTPTYTPFTHTELWTNLPNTPGDWIVKPCSLGMGIEITASCTVSKQEWIDALNQYNPNDVVFQPFLKQRRFNGIVGSEKRENDYVAGTLLYFEDGYYGPGLFRASSHPVTNQGDDRKIASSILNIEADKIAPDVLNEIMFL